MSTHHRRRVTITEDTVPDDLFRELGVLATTSVSHRFEPHGASEARLHEGRLVVVHTWPEHGLATIDVYGAPSPALE